MTMQKNYTFGDYILGFIMFMALTIGSFSIFNSSVLAENILAENTEVSVMGDGELVTSFVTDSLSFSEIDENGDTHDVIFPQNTDFTVTVPVGLTLKNAENSHLKTDVNGKLTFELTTSKTFQDTEKTVSFFQTQKPEISGNFAVKIWGVQGESKIVSGKSFERVFGTREKILDATPELSVEISGRNDDLSSDVKSVLQFSKTVDFAEISLEKKKESFVTLAADEHKISQKIQLLDDEKLEVGEYFVRVRSEDSAGRFSIWSPAFLLEREKDLPPNVPTSVSLFEKGTDTVIPNTGKTESGSVDIHFFISDKNAGQRLKYQVQVSLQENFSEISQDIASPDFVLAGNQSETLMFLTPEKKYFVRVRTIDEGENFGKWSDSRSFSTVLTGPKNLFVRAKANIQDDDSYANMTGKDVEFSDRDPFFGFTLPEVSTLPVFSPRSFDGKGVSYYALLNSSNGSFSTARKRLSFSGYTGEISEESLSGAFQLEDNGYLYLNSASVPSIYKQYLPGNFHSVQNNTKGALSQRAWSNVFGWVSFASSNADTTKECSTPRFFDGEDYRSCVATNGKIEGYAKIEHPVFVTAGIENYFAGDWASAQQHFINGQSYTEKIFHPLLTAEKIEELEDGELKTKLQTLWGQDGGYLRFSDSLVAVPEKMHTSWRPDGVQVMMDMASGVQNGNTPKILVNGLEVFDQADDMTANYSVVHLTGGRWEVFAHQNFDISANEAKASAFKTFLDGIPAGDIILLTTGKNPTLHADVFQKSLENFGATPEFLTSLSSTDGYIFVGRKGKTFPLFEERFSGKNGVYTQNRAGLAPVVGDAKGGRLFQGTSPLGFLQTQNLGHLVFVDDAHDIESTITGTENIGTPENSGIIGTAFSTAAGRIHFDADNTFGATNRTPDDYGVTIDHVNASGEIFLRGRAWGDGIGFLEMYRGEYFSEKCEAQDTPKSNFGVCVDRNGAFHGFAWSPSFGWVSFENIHSHDPFSSGGYTFEMVELGGSKYNYSTDHIKTGDIVLPLAEIQESFGKNCTQNPENCLLPFGEYTWRVKSTVGDVSSPFTPKEKFTLRALAPELTHQCLSTISFSQSFDIGADDKNIPELGMKYRIKFTDKTKGYYIDSLRTSQYSTPENNVFHTKEKDFSAFNGRKITYHITLTNSAGETSQQECENVLVRGMKTTLISPVSIEKPVSRNPDFQFQVDTIVSDSYSYQVEVQEMPENSTPEIFTWNDSGQVFTATGTQDSATASNFHTEHVVGLNVGKNYCWKVTATSNDGTTSSSEVKCFTTENKNPEISDLTLYGNSAALSNITSSKTEDTTPEFRFKVYDDSISVDAEIKIYNNSGAVVQTIVENNALNADGSASFSMRVPSELPVGTYSFVLTVVDNSGASSFQEGGFIIVEVDASLVGYGNIGTAYITVDNNEEAYLHRFGYDSENNIGSIDFNPVSGGVHISSNKVYGYAWNLHTGWIRFSCAKNPSTMSVPVGYTNNISQIEDNNDPYCGDLLTDYGVVPGVLDRDVKKPGEVSENSQDLLGKAKFEIFDIDNIKKTEFLYFDWASYKEDFPSANNADNWRVNEHGRKAVGIDKDGKISGYAWSPSFGWISMGRNQFTNPNWSNYYPITEYLPAVAGCIIEDPIKEHTYEAEDSRTALLLNACAGETLQDVNLSVYEKNENGTYNKLEGITSANGITALQWNMGAYSYDADRIFYIWGTLKDSVGNQLDINQDDAIKIKVVANSHPDFRRSKIFISDGIVRANGNESRNFTIELLDRFGNIIYNDTDIAGRFSKSVEMDVYFSDSVRLNQLAKTVVGDAATISGLGNYFLDNSDPSVSLKGYKGVKDEIGFPFSYAINSLSPTQDALGTDLLDVLKISLKIKKKIGGITDIIDKTFEKTNERKMILSDDDVNTSNLKIISTAIKISSPLFGNVKFENPVLDENADTLSDYSVSITQSAENIDTQIPEKSDTPFHFLHCFETLPSTATLDFNPIIHKGKSSNVGCYETASNTADTQSKFEEILSNSLSEAHYKGDDGNLPEISIDDNSSSRIISFQTRAAKTGPDIPNKITPVLYVAYKTNNKWVKYKIPSSIAKALSFIQRSGYIDGTTHGQGVYNSEVSNKNEGVFSQVESVVNVESLRNSIIRSLSSYKIEKGGELPEISEKVTLSSSELSTWLQGEDVTFSDAEKITLLDEGNMIWVKGRGDDFVVQLGRDIDIAIDDRGIGPSKTIVVEGGNAEINADIFRRGTGVLAIIVLRHPDQLTTSGVDGNNYEISGNILIDSGVKNIRAMMYADGSVLSSGYKSFGTDGTGLVKKIFDGWDDDDLRSNFLGNQLYILGSISSLNTYGGTVRSEQQDKNDVYINTMINRPVWKNSEFESCSNADCRKNEAMRFDLKRLRDYHPTLTYSDDADGNNVRDYLDVDLTNDGKIDSDDIAYCEQNKTDTNCVPQLGTYVSENSAQASFFDPEKTWDEEGSLLKSQTSVIFEYDGQIQKNSPPGTLIYSDLLVQ